MVQSRGREKVSETAGMSLRSNIIGCGIWRGRELPLFFCCCFFCCRFFLGKGAHPPHFCRIININFLLFFHGNSLGQKFTILESSGKRRLVCLKHETTYVAGWIWDISFFFIRTPSPHPHHPLWKAIVGSFCCRHHWRLHPRSPKYCRRLKTEQRPPFIVYRGREGVGWKNVAKVP